MKVETTGFMPLELEDLSESEISRRAADHYKFMVTRRSVREYSSRPVPPEVIENIIKAAATAPSGANKQPWTFCVVSSKEVKQRIRESAEAEEFVSYKERMGDEWIKDLEPFGTNHIKEFIDVCPYIIVVFKKIYEVDSQGLRHNNYYVNESVGIATGFLISAIHQAGLVCLAHTPSPMNFLQHILERPENERPFLMIPVGYPAENVKVPNIARKPLNEVSVFYH